MEVEETKVSVSEEGAADKVKGATIFRQRCATCHSTKSPSNSGSNHGPNLQGLFGRRVADDNTFKSYSLGAKYKDIVWNDEHLSQFLANPRKFIPGTRMIFTGIRHKQDRRDIIAHLKDATKEP